VVEINIAIDDRNRLIAERRNVILLMWYERTNVACVVVFFVSLIELGSKRFDTKCLLMLVARKKK